MGRKHHPRPERANDRDYYGPCSEEPAGKCHRSPERANDGDYYGTCSEESPRKGHRSPERANDRDYYGPCSEEPPRKRSRQPMPVFVGDIRVPFQQVVDFMNRVMAVEGFTRDFDDRKRLKDPDGDDAYVGDAILGFRQYGKSSWIVEAATDALSEKLLYLNRIPFNNTILRISLPRSCNFCCKYSCWNEYHFKRYGENDNVLDTEIIVHLGEALDGESLLTFLNEKIKFHGLDELEDREPIERIRGMISLKSFVLTMASPVEGDRILYLNGIQMGNTTVTIQRSSDWIGPEPRFRKYLEFLRAKSDSNAERRNDSIAKPSSPQTSKPAAQDKAARPEPHAAQTSKPAAQNKAARPKPRPAQTSKSPQSKKAPPQSSTSTRTETIELLCDSDDEVQIVEEHEEIKRLEKENKRLRTVLNAMKHSNDAKAQEIATLMPQFNDLEAQVSTKKSEALQLEDDESKLSIEINDSRVRVNAIHEDWQKQAVELMKKQKEIEKTRAQLEQLKKDAKAVAESLLDEQRECQQVENALARFAAQPPALAVLMKLQQQQGKTDQKPVVAASDDAFDV